MSEVEKTLTDAYYWLSMYKSGAITEGVAMEKVKEAIFDQPQLNENQEIVLWWLKEEQTKNPELSIFGTLSVLFDESENRFMNLDVIDALNDLSNSQQAGVFQAFSKWDLGWRNECE
ncbi:hypothetical protein [Enterococcus gallinarum]|uniref:hypothetical protein n=1 Tax=Enterococcus gallinarum TaxID=1353 RepID=UPI00288FA823|nr:hypothetical protein [Enterococcus gallinarum]MDT2686257.1 hypothetical protein [Enterococcus gallinarum]